MKFDNPRLKKTAVKVVASLFAAGMAVLSYTAAIDALIGKTFLGKLDRAGETYLNETLKRSVYTFAVARGVNGVISVIQGTDVSVSPAGIGLKIAVGEALDPVNDLIERFSWVMLLSSTSLGVQKILMEMAVWFGFRILLSAAMVVALAGIWLPGRRVNLKSLGVKLAVAAVIIRFCIPAVAFVSDGVYTLFLEIKYRKAIESLEKVNRELKDTTLMEKAETGYLDRLKKIYDSSVETLKFEDKIRELKEKVSEYSGYIIDLIVVFIIQTVIIPILSLWLLVRFGGLLCGKSFSFQLAKSGSD